MKKLLLLLLLTSCTISNKGISDEPLQPLPTTGLSDTKPTINLITSPSASEAFVGNFYRSFTGFKSLPKAEIINSGKYFCNLMRSGVTSREIASNIRLSVSTTQEQQMMLSILANATLDLCPPSE